MYKCPGCGAALRFDPKTQHMVCDHCRKELSPKDPDLVHYNLSYEAESATALPDGTFNSMVYTCPNCGATLLSTEETAATFCNYCGSAVALEGRLENLEAPDVIIPFQLNKEDCKTVYKNFARRALFAPSYMKSDTEIEKFRGIYMPYWIYSFYAEGPSHGTGKTSHRSGDYIITDHYAVDRDVSATYEGISYDAASEFSDVMSDAISPYRAVGAEPFRESYMSGFYADVSDVDKAVYEEDAAQVATNYVSGETMKHPDYLRHGVSSVTVPIEGTNHQKGYFPVWFLANQTPDRKHVSYVVVNGETGKIAAEFPIAFWKYLLASFLLAIPIFLLLNAVFTVTPIRALVATLVISVIMLIVLNIRFNQTIKRNNHTTDRGLQYRLSQAPLEAPEAADTPENAREKAKNSEMSAEKKRKTLRIIAILFWVALFIVGFAAFYILGRTSSKTADIIVNVTIPIAIVSVVVYFIISSQIGRKKEPKKENASAGKWKYLIKPVIGIVVSILVLLIHPVADFWYYGAAIFADLLTVSCAFDAVKLYNEETMRPLPQFGRRGGTGNE